MSDSTRNEPPFDERAAIIELERFRQEIERYRVRRQVVAQQFDAFIESMPAPEEVFPRERETAPPTVPPPPAAPPAVPRPTMERHVAAAPQPAPPAVPTKADRVPAVHVAPQAHTAVDEQRIRPAIDAAAPVLREPAKKAGARRMLPIVLTIGVLIAIGAFAVSMFKVAAPPSSPQSAPQPAAPAAETPPPAPATPAAPAASPGQPTQDSEIVTVRRAWVRVVADGERVVERELPADSRISFKAERTIVIRTGDAGAVKLTIRGRDQGLLGKDGAVVTRTFTVATDPPR